MRSFNIKGLLPVTILLIIYSCKKVINVNLNDAAPQIVITGNVTDSAGPYTVQITKTVDFSATNTFPAVPGAIVKITDSNAVQTDSLIETSPGIYTTQTLLLGIPGHTYQLYVLSGGQTYRASSTMPQPVNLDSVSFLHSNNFGKTTINATVNFQDPPNIANYYTFTELYNGKQLNGVFVFDDRLSDGKYISEELRNDSSYLEAGNTLLVQMNCVDENVYNYFNTLRQVTNGDNFQSTTPSNPLSNISNNALGYFSANTVQYKTVAVK